MRLFCFALLALAAGPAAAQDLAADYAAAARIFTLPGVESLARSDLLDDEPIVVLLPSLVDRWLPINALFLEPADFDPERFADMCESLGVTLTPIAARSFELRRTPDPEGDKLSIRHDFVLGNTLDQSVTEQELLGFLDLNEIKDLAV